MEPERVPCDGCGKAINDRFAKCPFCGLARRPPAEVRPTSLDAGAEPPRAGALAAGGLSKEQRVAAAQNVMLGRPDAPVTGAGTGMLSALVPSSNTRSWMRTAEIVLTVISFPFFVASMVGILFQGVKRWGRIDAFTWTAGAFFGSILLWVVLYVTGLPAGAIGWIVGVGFVSWCLRGVLRFVAAAQRLSDYS